MKLVDIAGYRRGAGLCLVRLEHRSDGLLITIQTSSDIEQVSAESVSHTTDIEGAIRIIREFMTTFADSR
ncbi:hypothetical protein EV644_12413 [Kribbella orskensis]|uniref:Uncharacterized protein n=1 Tax=Kribbella orskensis TaxID=2512216 RepID=A0ABY2BAB3_9ACTN|nr:MULTISPECIES: hypothetical protein [Kribbella]TCN32793.1 hypothetical protein EV642_12685 [Kribbella sp. VKM Ac-2500]TCO12889.1 hypothetical protein EV644_12413 [Kribbella orskensis]